MPTTTHLHITDSHVAKIKYHISNIHSLYRCSCNLFDVICVVYSLNQDKLPGHSPTTSLGTRLALSQLYMQYATVVSYPGCLVALQLWILDNILHMMFEGSHVTVCNIQAYCCSQQALLPTFTWWEPPHLSSVNAPLAVDSQSFTTSIWPTEQVLASQATALSMGTVHSYTEVRRSMNKAHRLCLVHFKCLVYCDRCNRNSITVMWQRSEIWLLLPTLWQWN